MYPRDYARFEERWALHRLGPVGRLDKATTGLLLFTDDGGLAKRLVAAGTCRKTYVLDVAGDVTDAALASLARPLDDVTLHTREAVRTAPADVAVLWWLRPFPFSQFCPCRAGQEAVSVQLASRPPQLP